jgi:hypothetical protein
VGRDVPIRGPLMIRKYVLSELAHRRGDELLLWDFWADDAAFVSDLGGRPLVEAWPGLPSWETAPVDLIDEIADLLLAADAGDEAAEHKLASRYADDPRIRLGDVVTCHSPRGLTYNVNPHRPSPPPTS